VIGNRCPVAIPPEEGEGYNKNLIPVRELELMVYSKAAFYANEECKIEGSKTMQILTRIKKARGGGGLVLIQHSYGESPM